MFEMFVKLYMVCMELAAGFKVTSGLGRIITVLGSARLQPGDKHYDAAFAVAHGVAAAGNAVVTGGGPGIMEGANKGACAAGAKSVGCSIVLPQEQSSNLHISKGREAKFKWFFLRKFVMFRRASAFIVFAGGFGTLDELFEALTLIQCQMQKRPVTVILYGSDFWDGLVDWLYQVPYKKYHTISYEDLSLFRVVNSVDEAVALACEGPDLAYADLSPRTQPDLPLCS